jgi:hypothetical protein
MIDLSRCGDLKSLKYGARVTMSQENMTVAIPSIFRKGEKHLALEKSSHEPLYADSPHECCPYSRA